MFVCVCVGGRVGEGGRGEGGCNSQEGNIALGRRILCLSIYILFHGDLLFFIVVNIYGLVSIENTYINTLGFIFFFSSIRHAYQYTQYNCLYVALEQHKRKQQSHRCDVIDPDYLHLKSLSFSLSLFLSFSLPLYLSIYLSIYLSLSLPPP